MKRSINAIIKMWAAYLLIVLAATACDLTDVNVNPNQPSAKEKYNFDGARLANAFRSSVPVMDGDDEQRIKSLIIDFNTQMLDGGGYDMKNYISNEEWNQRMYRRIQTSVSNLNIAIRNLTGRESEYAKTIAVAKIWRVYVQSNGVDYFGPIPFAKYSESEDNPPYMSVEDTYIEFFRELDDAVELLTKGEYNIFDDAASDVVYRNDAAKWSKFASSLRLRLAMRLTEADPAKCRQEVAKALVSDLIDSSADNAKVPPRADGGWGADYNYTMFQVTWSGPLVMSTSFEKLVEGIGGIAWEGSNVNRRAVYSNKAVEERIDGNFAHPALIDPRATLMFDPPYGKPQAGAAYGNTWKGLTPGLHSSERGKDENNRNYYPELGILFNNGAPYKSRPYDVMLYEEVCFLKAEAFLRGFAAGDAKEEYEKGVAASFATWGVSKHSAAYLTSTEKNIAGTSARFDDLAGAGNTQLEKIITQKYLSFFPDMAMEAWNDKRRLNLPRMDVPASRNELLYDNSDKDIRKSSNFIKRIQYPGNEKQINQAEYEKGVKLLGGPDVVSTPVWWDKNVNYCTSAE
ncbi:MAG: SusD/RagB family nutrient-binding outer membrane lipoprotein [Tannerellaceae bacterium]|nr:SusD/RagB family nutrient-binding outer membrane lipoprotein [Tannerellaceae bacterium]